MDEGYTHIRISVDVRDRLKDIGSMGDTYDDVISWLLDQLDEFNELENKYNSLLNKNNKNMS